MSAVDFLLRRWEQAGDREAIGAPAGVVTYEWLVKRTNHWAEELEDAGIPAGHVVALSADFSPEAVAALVALIDRGAVVVPLTDSVRAKRDEFVGVAEVEYEVTIGHGGTSVVDCGRRATHPLLRSLLDDARPGLVLFSSGSTGASKAALHDFGPLLEKFHQQRHAWRTMAFLLFDHIGGVNTLLYTLSNLGMLVTVSDRSPESVCRAIEEHRVQTLPTSPTFLNLLLLSGAADRYDLSSLELITYGTEVMPESLLARLVEAFPTVRFQQTYGLSEVGILRSKSKDSSSLFVKIGGEGFETRVVDGLLEIKARSAMLGYLNAPSPFTPDGWFKTGDAVEIDGEYMRILGRRSEIINVGGEKVWPAEVESVVRELAGVVDVAVRGEPHAITGMIVSARVQLATDEELPAFRARLRRHCQERLPRYAVPQKVVITSEPLHGERFKKQR